MGNTCPSISQRATAPRLLESSAPRSSPSALLARCLLAHRADAPGGHKVRDLRRQPGCHAQCHRVREAKVRHVARPERAEVGVQADLAPAVHLLSLAVNLRERELGRHGRVGHRELELEVELVAEEVVHEPHLARPLGAHLVGLDGEPVVAGLLIHLLVGDECHVLLLEALHVHEAVAHPGRDPARAQERREQHGVLRAVPFLGARHLRGGPEGRGEVLFGNVLVDKVAEAEGLLRLGLGLGAGRLAGELLEKVIRRIDHGRGREEGLVGLLLGRGGHGRLQIYRHEHLPGPGRVRTGHGGHRLVASAREHEVLLVVLHLDSDLHLVALVHRPDAPREGYEHCVHELGPRAVGHIHSSCLGLLAVGHGGPELAEGHLHAHLGEARAAKLALRGVHLGHVDRDALDGHVPDRHGRVDALDLDGLILHLV
mmetsp:Transcript_19456/g.65280  ORF Transcript_19456/g.65280 Transcript_19456/m.65280 type:complete len:428 (-) Transcript_19456:556-1839(-)